VSQKGYAQKTSFIGPNAKKNGNLPGRETPISKPLKEDKKGLKAAQVLRRKHDKEGGV